MRACSVGDETIEQIMTFNYLAIEVTSEETCRRCPNEFEITRKILIIREARRLTSGLLTRGSLVVCAFPMDNHDALRWESVDGAPIKDATRQNGEVPITEFPRSSPFTDEFIGL